MKNFFKARIVPLFGIIALVAVIGFGMAVVGCDNGSTSGNGGSNAALGATLGFSKQQVYTENINEATNAVTYTAYTGGDLTLYDGSGGTVTITEGKFSYTIESPDYFTAWDDMWIFSGYDNVTPSDMEAEYFILNFYGQGGGNRYNLSRSNVSSINFGSTSGTQTYEQVTYVYADRDVTVSGKGRTTTESWEGYTYTSKTNNFSLLLKAGWNAVYTKNVLSSTYPAGKPGEATSQTNNVTMSLSNPSLRWVLYE